MSKTASAKPKDNRPRIPAPRQLSGRPDGRASFPVGTKSITKEGFVLVKVNKYTWEREHRVVAEEALGKPLPWGCVVGHVNGNKQDNRKSNLLICENTQYLMELDMRRRLKAMGLNPFLFKIVDGLVEYCGPE